MRRRSPLQLEVKHDRWLVSYSDFITLLFAFFVVMYSISQVSEGKYRVLSSTLLEAFSVPQSAINPIQVGEPTKSVSPDAIELFKRPETGVEQEPAIDDVNLQKLETEVTEQFVDLINDDLLQINSNELWLELELNSNILFPTGSADPSLQAKGIFEEIANMFSSYTNQVQVEGFTDNVPINNRQYKSNWELSAARAASVVKLLARNGVDPTRLSAVGKGEFQPIADNNTAEGRAKNRRVVVMIAKTNQSRPQVNSDSINNVFADNPPAENNTETDNLINLDEEQTSNTVIPDASSVEEDPKITPIELNNGGLLFTSDPELQRNNLPQNVAPQNVSPQNNSSQDSSPQNNAPTEQR